MINEKLDKLIKKTHLLWREGRENETIPYFEEAISILRKENNKKLLIEVLNDYAGALRVTGKYDEALNTAYEACTLIESNYSINSEAYANSIMNLANIYRMKGDFYKSEELFLKSEFLFKKLNILNYSLAGLYNNISLLYQSLFQYEKAYDYQIKSIEINKKDEKYNVPLGISYNNLYEICKKLNKIEEAENYLNLAENILVKEVGVNHPLYCSVLNNFADLYFRKKELEKSYSLYKLILPLIEKFYGKKSDYYYSVNNNFNIVKDELEDKSKKNVLNNNIDSTGMNIAKEFFKEEIFPFFEKYYSHLLDKIAFGLVGQGSECFGFDDKISQDHDFGKRLTIWLDESIDINLKNELENKLTTSFKAKIEIFYISEFYKTYTFFTNGPESLEEFRKVPSDLLAIATNGEIFYDKLGKFSKIRERLLKFYPDDLVYKKIAFCLNKIAQSGQYNYPRCLKRKNYIGCEMAMSEFIQYYSHFWHLINKRYMPFYKWYKKSLEHLKINGMDASKKLEHLISLNINERVEYIEELCNEIKNYLINNNFTTNKNSFLLLHAEEIVKNIKDENLKSENTWIN